MSDEKYLSKLAALLRQAESTNNAHEAESFMAAAQRLSTATQISLEVARQHQADKEKRETPIQKSITIGESGKKGLKYYVRLFLAIARQNDVTCNIAHNSTYVIAFGFPSDIEMVEMLYGSLVYQMVDASNKFLQSGAYKGERGERVWVEGKYRNGEYIPGHYKEKTVDGRVARSNFMEAFISKISSRLAIARLEAIETVKAEQAEVSPESTGTDIVLANKALEVADFYKQKSNARGHWGGYSASKGYSGASRAAGAAAGERARIGASKAIGGTRTAIG